MRKKFTKTTFSELMTAHVNQSPANSVDGQWIEAVLHRFLHAQASCDPTVGLRHPKFSNDDRKMYKKERE